MYYLKNLEHKIREAKQIMKRSAEKSSFFLLLLLLLLLLWYEMMAVLLCCNIALSTNSAPRWKSVVLLLQVQYENQQGVSLPYVSRIVDVYIESVSISVVYVFGGCTYALDHGYNIPMSTCESNVPAGVSGRIFATQAKS